MSYEQARNEALFLTDKMAYELNLTDEQYEAAYEINLDYLMGVTSRDDVYGVYWERRNLDLSYILLDWQWEAFRAAAYFFRPLYWLDGFWHFAIYGRYPHRDYFFFGRPAFYATYRGGHAWHVVGGRGYYHSHSDHFRHAPAAGRHHVGMHDRWERGEYNHGRHHTTRPGIGNTTHHGGPRSSSTQSTVNRPTQGNMNRPTQGNMNRPTHHSDSGHSTMAENRLSSGGSSSHSSGSFSRNGGSSSHSSGSFSRSSGSTTRSSGSFSRSGGSSAGHSSHGGRSYGGRR